MENEENYRKQVIRTFFKNGMLLKIPIQNRKKDVVLQKIATRFLPDKMYSEEELNELLKRIYADHEPLKTIFLASRFVKKINDQFSVTSQK